ncbi:hypothetical protein [Microbacterium sp. S1037]|uniref:hypothetical protein n=1 Tax=Microbacterium sp. S1037 TaxID=3398227 RepID=UPI003AAAE95A
MTHDIEQNAPALSPTRRTVLTGAAWTLPVIAAATITPMAAASNAPVLAFDKSTYNGTACGTITGAYVTVTVNNVATAGKSVTTTLSNGYKFSDDTTTNTQVSGADGRVNLPTINVPSSGGSAVASATSSNSAVASSSLSAPAIGSAHRYFHNKNGNSGIADFTSVPNGSTPVGGIGFLSPAGDLYWANNGKVATGVSKAVGGIDEYGQYVIEFTSSNDGSVHRYSHNKNGNSGIADFTSVPNGSTPVGGIGFLSPAGDLYWANNGKVATGVSKAVGGIDEYGQYVIEFTSAPAC